MNGIVSIADYIEIYTKLKKEKSALNATGDLENSNESNETLRRMVAIIKYYDKCKKEDLFSFFRRSNPNINVEYNHFATVFDRVRQNLTESETGTEKKSSICCQNFKRPCGANSKFKEDIQELKSKCHS